MFNTPILFLTYKRPKETKDILNILLKIKPKKLYIFQDGMKNKFLKDETQNHLDTTKIIKKFKMFNSKKIFYKKNLGQRIIGYKILKHVFKYEDKCIILEDDCIPDKSFFKYCSIMLKKYKNDDTVAHISGCNLFYGIYKKKISDIDYFFSKYPHFMGWATWKNRWKKNYDPNIVNWPKYKNTFLKKNNLKPGEKRFFKFYLDKIYKDKKYSAWDVQWVYYNLLNDLKTVVPGVNLIKNIGYNSSPTGQSARKFRNLFTKNLKFPLKKINEDKINFKYDNFLYDSFYNRKLLFFRFLNKLKYKFKYFFTH